MRTFFPASLTRLDTRRPVHRMEPSIHGPVSLICRCLVLILLPRLPGFEERRPLLRFASWLLVSHVPAEHRASHVLRSMNTSLDAPSRRKRPYTPGHDMPFIVFVPQSCPLLSRGGDANRGPMPDPPSSPSLLRALPSHIQPSTRRTKRITL